MTRNSPYDGRQYSFNGLRSVSADELFTPASEISDQSNYEARQLAQRLVTDGGENQDGYRTDDCRFCEGTTESHTVDYYGNTVWACKKCGALL